MIRISAIFLALLLSACGGARKQYIQPQDPVGEQCVNMCQSDRLDCRKQLQDEQERCEARYRYQQRESRQCRSGDPSCVGFEPRPCPTPDYRVCTQRFDACFVGCGGSIL